MPHGLRSSTVPLITSSRITKSVTKPTLYTRLQTEQAVGAREVRAKRTETLSAVSVGVVSRAASRLGPTRAPREKCGQGQNRTADTRIFSPLTVARLCVPIGHYWYLFKRLTAVFGARFYRFEHIVSYSSGKVIAK